MTKNQLFQILLIFFLIGDFTFSFIQYYNSPLFGDITVSVWPDEHVHQILDDPFGLQVIKSSEKQFNPNRYFSHLFLKEYFRNVPLFLQRFVSPVSSVYLASAFVKIGIQILFVFILAAFISGKKILNKKFLIAAALITPLFQAYGYWSRMGIIDKSVAYTFFYAMPLVLLMLFFLPVFNRIKNNSKIRLMNFIYLVPLTIVLPFTGPLTAPVIILVSFVIFLDYWLRCKRRSIKATLNAIPKSIYLLLIPINLLSLYSLFLGLYDSSFASEVIPISERFGRLPEGILSQVFHSPGFPLMLLFIGINIYLVKKYKFWGSEKLMHILMWIGVFTLLYILLLPFGGYRPYRARIIRYDTFIPVNISLFYFFCASTVLVLSQIKNKSRKLYLTGIILYMLLLTAADFEGIGENKCERQAFNKMADATEKIVPIPKNCYVLDWHNVHDYRLTKNKAQLIHFWGITDEPKLFFNKQ